jgi:hypothetical protein
MTLLLLACTVKPAPSDLPNPDGSNSAPEASVALAPDVLTAATRIVAAADAVDVDGDVVVWDFIWSINGEVVQEGIANFLPAGTAIRGDEVTVEATAWDGIDASEPVSAAGTVENAPPVIVAVRIDPSDPVEGESLRCEADGEDADGDDLSWTTTFRTGGEDYGDEVPEDVTLSGETWFCVAVANDEEADSWPLDTYVVIE